jgi:hypothetical protein
MYYRKKSLSNIESLIKGLSNYLNYREPYLLLDYKDSTTLSINYDTDLENFWTQTSMNIISKKTVGNIDLIIMKFIFKKTLKPPIPQVKSLNKINIT